MVRFLNHSMTREKRLSIILELKMRFLFTAISKANKIRNAKSIWVTKTRVEKSAEKEEIGSRKLDIEQNSFALVSSRKVDKHARLSKV